MTPQRNAKLRGVLPILLVMTLILLMSATPGLQAGESFSLVAGPLRGWLRGTCWLAFLTRPDWFKVGHVIAYGVLGGLVYRAHRLKRLQNAAAQPSAAGIGEPFLRPLLIVLGFAILDELVQHFIPGRTAQLSDVILDTTAALIVMVVYKLIADSS